jgi:hypothetical protein
MPDERRLSYGWGRQVLFGSAVCYLAILAFLLIMTAGLAVSGESVSLMAPLWLWVPGFALIAVAGGGGAVYLAVLAVSALFARRLPIPPDTRDDAPHRQTAAPEGEGIRPSLRDVQEPGP